MFPFHRRRAASTVPKSICWPLAKTYLQWFSRQKPRQILAVYARLGFADSVFAAAATMILTATGFRHHWSNLSIVGPKLLNRTQTAGFAATRFLPALDALYILETKRFWRTAIRPWPACRARFCN